MAGNEQAGVNAGNTLSRQSSDSIAGIPIKKRRFPLVRPPSPPSQTPSLPVESDLQQKEQSNSKLESSSSNAVGPMAVSEFAATSKNSSEEEKSEHSNLIQSINPPGDNLQEPTLTIAFGSVSEAGNKMGDEFAFQNIAGNTELQLEPKETLVLQKEMKNEGKFVKDDKYDISKMPVNTELLLAPKEMALAAHNSQGICGDEEKVDPCSWNLGLNEGNNSNDGETKINRTPPHTQRSNWDLNTMMDTWDGSTNDSTAVHVANGLDGLDVAGKCVMKPLIYSTKKVLNESEGTSVTSENQILEKSEHSPELSGLPLSPDQQHKAGDLLHLSLSTSSGPVFCPGPSPSSTKFDSRSVLSSSSFSGKRVPQSSNLKPVGSRTVKSEPSDESNKQDLDKDRRLTPVDFRAVKSEPFERFPQESHKSSNVSILSSLDHGAVKSELGLGDGHETLQTVEGTSRPSECYTFIAERPIDGEALHCSDVTTCTVAVPSTVGLSSTSNFPSTLEISNSVEVASLSEFLACTKGMPSSGVQTQEASETVGEESKVDDANPESARLKLTVEVNVDSHVNNDLAGSDEERINLLADMQEDEDYCDTDDESDGNRVVGDVMDSKDDHHGGEDDDYEDGEVREPLVHNDTNYVHAKGEAECADHGEFNDREINVSGFPSDERGTTHIEDGNTKTEHPDETKDTCVSGECDNIMPNEKHDQCISPVTCLQESLTVEVTTSGTEKKKPIKAAQRKPLDHIAREDGLKVQEMELVSDGAPSASQGTSTGGGDQGDTGSQHDNVKGTTSVETKSPISSKMEAPVNVTEAIKDANSRGNRSRIINLARPFNGSPSSRVRSIPSRPLPSRIERERYNDVVLSGDKLHTRGNRNDSSIDGGHKFERQRNQDLPVVSTGSDFIHGRGRVDKRLDSPRVDWESDREFAPESCNGPTGFRFAGSKNTGLVSAAKAECSGFIVARVGTIVGAGRGGRKPLNDELPNFSHRPSRVRSPPGGGREGPVSHGVQVVRRSRRDISPGRCIGGGGPDLIGLRHEEKFIRSLPEDMMDPPVFSRPQPQYHRVDDSFTRRDRSFSPIPRRVPINIPRIRSKSPGNRARSPGPWSSPRRSPDGFGHSELTHRRSPPFYRMERMRSPHQRPCFADDMVGRRHGSPPFIPRLSNDMGEMVSTREHDRPRPFMPPNRSPSGRILQRGTRRFNVIDRRERTESDEYFGGPMHSGRFHEVGGDGGARIGGERRGPIRSFRPPYNDADVESFRFHVEDGPRTFRLCPEADADFHERGNLREREFERRIKNRPGNPPLRRTRSIEEQEENYRLGGEQGWHDGGLEDVSRVKRRRF